MLWFFSFGRAGRQQQVSPCFLGKDAVTHEPHKEEQCRTQAFIACAAEQATVAPASYPLKPHPQDLTHGPAGRALLPSDASGERPNCSLNGCGCQCDVRQRSTCMLTFHPGSGPRRSHHILRRSLVMTPHAEACPANVGPTP